MKATIESTDTIVDSVPIYGTRERADVLARVWEGVTEDGVEFIAYILTLQVRSDADNSAFERELIEHKRPSAETQRAIDLRHVL